MAKLHIGRLFDTLLVIISTALMSLNGIHLKRKKLSKFEGLFIIALKKFLCVV